MIFSKGISEEPVPLSKAVSSHALQQMEDTLSKNVQKCSECLHYVFI